MDSRGWEKREKGNYYSVVKEFEFARMKMILELDGCHDYIYNNVNVLNTTEWDS